MFAVCIGSRGIRMWRCRNTQNIDLWNPHAQAAAALRFSGGIID